MNLREHKRQLTILMTLLFSVSQACSDIFLPALPQMTNYFHTTISSMNLTISIFTYSEAVVFLFIGVLSDLFGRRKILIPCILIQIIASFLIATSSSLIFVIAMRVMQAIGSGAIYIVLRLIIKDVMDHKEQVKTTSLFLMGVVISPALAPIIGAWVISFFNWQATFILTGFLQGLLLIWVYFFIQETNLYCAEYRAKFSLKTHFAKYIHIFCDRLFLSMLIIVGGVFASFYAFLSISSYMYINQYHISHILYSFSFIGIAVSYLFGIRLMLWLNKKQINTLHIIRLGIVVSVIGVITMLIGLSFNNIPILLLGIITSGTFLIRMATAIINPITQVTVTHHFGKDGAYAIGLLSFIQFMSGGFGAYFVTKLPFSPSVSLVTSSVIFILITIFGYILCSKKQMIAITQV